MYPEASGSSEAHTITSSKSTSAALSAASNNNHNHNQTSNSKKTSAVVSSISIANMPSKITDDSTGNGLANGGETMAAAAAAAGTAATTSTTTTLSMSSSTTNDSDAVSSPIMTSSSASDDIMMVTVTRDQVVTAVPIALGKDELKSIENINIVDVNNVVVPVPAPVAAAQSADQTIYTMELTRSQVNFTLSDDSPISVSKDNTSKLQVKEKDVCCCFCLPALI